MEVCLSSAGAEVSPLTLGVALVSVVVSVSVPGAPGPEFTDRLMPCAKANLAAVIPKEININLVSLFIIPNMQWMRHSSCILYFRWNALHSIIIFKFHLYYQDSCTPLKLQYQGIKSFSSLLIKLLVCTYNESLLNEIHSLAYSTQKIRENLPSKSFIA